MSMLLRSLVATLVVAALVGFMITAIYSLAAIFNLHIGLILGGSFIFVVVWMAMYEILDDEDDDD